MQCCPQITAVKYSFPLLIAGRHKAHYRANRASSEHFFLLPKQIFHSVVQMRNHYKRSDIQEHIKLPLHVCVFENKGEMLCFLSALRMPTLSPEMVNIIVELLQGIQEKCKLL